MYLQINNRYILNTTRFTWLFPPQIIVRVCEDAKRVHPQTFFNVALIINTLAIISIKMLIKYLLSELKHHVNARFVVEVAEATEDIWMTTNSVNSFYPYLNEQVTRRLTRDGIESRSLSLVGDSHYTFRFEL